MRIGFNPKKDQLDNKSNYFHQIIVPVYVPNFEGYFKDGLKILDISLQSLFKTCHTRTFISVVNNGSCIEVKNYLNDLLNQNKIQELTHSHNIGKLNAVLKGIAGANFKLITITDADVLFLNHWQQATYEIFNAFPKAGAICPTPSPKSLRVYTANIYWDLFFSKKLKFSEVKNPTALLNFAKSIGNHNFYNDHQLKQYLTIEYNNCKAVVGAGHFVTTYKSDVFNNMKNNYSSYKLGGDSEGKILDKPVVSNGLWRLSTADNFAYHLGNVHEAWMDEQLNQLNYNELEFNFDYFSLNKPSKFTNFLINKVFSKFILNKKIFKKFALWKGLSKKGKDNYL